jgi:hypothetical protein
MRLLNFFIDELGSASLRSTQSSHYVLSGIMVSAQGRQMLKIKADQIKFKYWGDVDVIFHSREIGRKLGSFSILNDAQTDKNFTQDLIRFLKTGPYQLFGVVVDKSKVPKNWNEITIYKKTAEEIVKSFIFALLAQSDCRGRLIIESATAQKDFYYHKIAGYYLSNGFKKLKVDYQQVQQVLTEISFVTKKNYDIEEQLADLLAYGLKLKYEKRPDKQVTDYERRLIDVVECKLFKMHPNTGKKKKRLYSQIESFKIIP